MPVDTNHRRAIERSLFDGKAASSGPDGVVEGNTSMNAKVTFWITGLILMASHVGCCSLHPMGGGCGACGDVCDSGCADHGPFHTGLLRQRIASGIHNGIHNGVNNAACGEIYWDERINEPPVCDPCGTCGEFTEGSCDCCPPILWRLRPLQHLRTLWGTRYEGGGCHECSTCGTSPSGSSHCATCGHHAEPMGAMPAEMEPAPMAAPSYQSAPKGSPKVRSNQEEVVPAPVPDPNAKMRRSPSDRRSLLTGSGVVAEDAPMALSSSVKSSSNPNWKKPLVDESSDRVPSKSKSTRVKSRLVTNPK